VFKVLKLYGVPLATKFPAVEASYHRMVLPAEGVETKLTAVGDAQDVIDVGVTEVRVGAVGKADTMNVTTLLFASGQPTADDTTRMLNEFTAFAVNAPVVPDTPGITLQVVGAAKVEYCQICVPELPANVAEKLAGVPQPVGVKVDNVPATGGVTQVGAAVMVTI
jgi:hypothetical protein